MNEVKERNDESEFSALLCVDLNECDQYNVHIDISGFILEFDIYPVNEWRDSKGNDVGRFYIDKNSQPNELEKFDPDRCLKVMEGSYCWRGAWEGRLYFTDDEYWGEDIEKLSELYNNHIVPWCKVFIMKRDPSNYYDT